MDLNRTSERLTQLFEEQRALAARLEETNASLARASEAKSRFLASVSHELRTPMNAILGFTDALLGGVDGPLNPDQTASLGWVQRGGRDLLGLINEILDLSKIEAGRLTIDPQPFDPRELVESVVAQYRSLAAQKGIQFAWRDDGAPSEVVLDRQRVSQILVNLFGNALKFTLQGEVRVETRGGTESVVPGRRAGHRSGHPGRPVRGDLRGVPAGRGRRARHRPRPGDQPPPRPGDGRRHHARQRTRARERLLPHPAASTAGSNRSIRPEPSRPPSATTMRAPPERRRRSIGCSAAREDAGGTRLSNRRIVEREHGCRRRPSAAPGGDHPRHPACPAGTAATSSVSSRATRKRATSRSSSSRSSTRPTCPDLADGYLTKPVRQDRLLSLLDDAQLRLRGRALMATILLVEDTPANRALATKLLVGAGHRRAHGRDRGGRGRPRPGAAAGPRPDGPRAARHGRLAGR